MAKGWKSKAMRFTSKCPREFDQVFAKAAAYDENLAFLRTMLQALHRCGV